MAQRWGNKTVGSGKALVRLTQVLVPGAKPSFLFNDPASGQKWDSKTTTLAQLETELGNPLLMVRTSLLEDPGDLRGHNQSKLRIDNIFDHPSSTQPHGDRGSEVGTSVASSHTLVTAAEAVIQNVMDMAPLTGVHNYAASNNLADENNEPPREDESNDELPSLIFEDLFHQFDTLPFLRTCPVKTLISRLLIHATFIFIEDDYNQFVAYRSAKAGVTNFLDDFYYNREMWRKCVRRVVPSGETHACEIKKIHDFVKLQDATNEFYTSNLKDYFEKFALKCRKG